MKPILCLDFDGVIHRYRDGWKGPTIIDDVPVDGALIFMKRATERFNVAIFSTRSRSPGGIAAMQDWLAAHYMDDLEWNRFGTYEFVRNVLSWPTEKPPAMVTLDDRALTFMGTWPTIDELLAFKPWHQRDAS